MFELNFQAINRFSDYEKIPNEELGVFLKEWFDEKSYVIGHTSGSTGKPKEIYLDKEDMRASARLTNEFFEIGSESLLLLCLSVGYIAGKMMVVRALEARARLCVVKVSSHPLKELVDSEEIGRYGKIDLAAMVPMQVEETLKVANEKVIFANIRRILIGGAPIVKELENQLKWYAGCYATYGMTETVSHIALRKLNSKAEYFALGEVNFTTDDRGCLIIHAPHLKAQQFITNDLVKWIDTCHFEWLGRYDNVINSGGIKFFPERLEAKMSSCFSGRFFITSEPDPLLGQRIVLVVEGKLSTPLSKLFRQFRQLLSVYEMPRKIFTVPFFRETTSGKIIRDISGLTLKLEYDAEKK